MDILKQAEAVTSVAELCREQGMSNDCFYKWRSRFGSMDASTMNRLKELKDEKRHLKKCMLKSDSKLKSFRRRWQKSGEAIASKADVAGCCKEPECQHSFCLPDVCCQQKLLPLPSSTE